MKKSTVYKMLALSNDYKAAKNGRLLQRLWNRLVLKQARKLMK